VKSSKPVAPFSPEKAREERQVEASRLLDESMTAASAHGPTVAASLGVPESTMQRWRRTRGQTLDIQLADVMGLPPEVLRLVLERVADSIGLAIVDRPDSLATEDHVGLAAVAMHESADVVAAHAQAIRDRHITRSEGANLERECDEALRPILAIREIARLAQREGVVGIGGGKPS
jgi:hypothetical protein